MSIPEQNVYWIFKKRALLPPVQKRLFCIVLFGVPIYQWLIDKFWDIFVTDRQILQIFSAVNWNSWFEPNWWILYFSPQPIDEFCNIFEIFPSIDWQLSRIFLPTDRRISDFFPATDWKISPSLPDRLTKFVIFFWKWDNSAKHLYSQKTPARIFQC